MYSIHLLSSMDGYIILIIPIWNWSVTIFIGIWNGCITRNLMTDSKKDKENYLRVDVEVEKGNHDTIFWIRFDFINLQLLNNIVEQDNGQLNKDSLMLPDESFFWEDQQRRVQSSDEYLCCTCTKTARFSYRLVLQQICFTHSMQFFKGYKMAYLAFTLVV
jgi:hypothetical protein